MKKPTPLHPYPAAVLATVRGRRLAGPTDALLVAASGGPDSLALLGALAVLRDAGHVGALSAVHVDHGLRAGGAQDAACVRAACDRLGVPFTALRVAVGPGNLQASARRARYAALRAEAARAGADRIATGHTRDDQAETVLLRLLRGAGARGLAAIPPRRGLIIRPLLDRTREEGLAWLRALGLDWRDDPTNMSPRFLRNRVRAEVLPVLRALAPRAVDALARTADLAREDERALAARARGVVERAGGGPVPAAALRRLPAAVRRRVVRRLFRLGGGRGLEAAHVAAVLALVGRGAGACALPGGLEARVTAAGLRVGPSRARARAAPPPEPVVVPGPGRFPIPFGAYVEVSVGDPAALGWPLELRTRRPGDRFSAPGGTKKLKAWLIDRKIPRDERETLLVLARGGDVMAIPALGVVARGLGPRGARLEVRLAAPGAPA